MSEKEKPMVHEVVGEVSAELYCEDLDWYFGCFDMECGLKSAQQAAEERLIAGTNLNKAPTHDEDDWEGTIEVKLKAYAPTNQRFPYTDRHVRFSRNEGSFTRGRRIHNRLIRIPLSAQKLLEAYYTPKRDKPEIDEDDVRSAHRAYYR